MPRRRKKVKEEMETRVSIDEISDDDMSDLMSAPLSGEEPVDTSSWSSKYIEAAGSIDGWSSANHVLDEISAVRTVFPDFNRASQVGGLPVRRIHTIHGPTHGGKAIRFSTFVVLTPTGYRYVKDMSIGDPVVGKDGETYSLTGIFPQGVKQLYRITFSDGATVDCDGDHFWYTTTRKERNRGRYFRGPRPERQRIPTGVCGKGSVKSTLDILNGFKPRIHAIPIVEPIKFKSIDELPIHPYVLGALIGDGSFTQITPAFCNPEDDVCEKLTSHLPDTDTLQNTDRLQKYISGRGVLNSLRELKLFGCRSWEKFIPEQYLRASISDRILLLQGICDTDGHVHEHGTYVEYTTVSKKLADDVCDVVRGLGGVASCKWRATTYTHKGEKLKGRESARISIWFNNGICPVSSKKHLAKWKTVDDKRNDIYRTMVSIEKIDEDESCCISVDSPDNLFVTNDYVVTHNTAFVLGLVKSFVDVGYLAGYIDAEYSLGKKFAGEIVSELESKPNFLAVRPENYEQTIARVDAFLHKAMKIKEKFSDSKAILVIDSINKLIPKRELDKMLKQGQINEKGANELTKGHHGRYRAALNQAWLDQLTPKVSRSDTALLIIAQERDDQDTTDFFSSEFKVKGGAALLFDASLVMRIMKSSPIWIKPSEDKSNENIGGFSHRVRIWKSKVGYMDGRYTDCKFSISNGKITPKGLDIARDAITVGIELGIIVQSGAWYSYKGRRTQGLNNFVKRLSSRHALLCDLLNDISQKLGEEHE